MGKSKRDDEERLDIDFEGVEPAIRDAVGGVDVQRAIEMEPDERKRLEYERGRVRMHVDIPLELRQEAFRVAEEYGITASQVLVFWAITGRNSTKDDAIENHLKPSRSMRYPNHLEFPEIVGRFKNSKQRL